MISYDWPRLRGRFGNQLFQYAFIRTTAQKLETKFFFPPWLGDKIFILNDDAERTDKDSSLQHFYREKISGERFDKLSLNIQDGTKIKGIFQSEDYFDRDDIIEWFKFKDNIFSNVVKKYNYIDFSDSTGIHLRFGDKVNNLKYVIPKINYYQKALEHINYRNNILIFSDDIAKAKEIFGTTGENYTYINSNEDYEDLYLMTRCHDFICSGSTFSWWGAYLNNYPDKTIVAPWEWLRPGQIFQKSGLRCNEWVFVKTCRFIIDDYRLLMGIEVIKQMLANLKNKNFDLRLSNVIKSVKKRK